MLSKEDISRLERVGCFSIGTYNPWKIPDRDAAENAACRRFVRPLIQTASHARLFPSRDFTDGLRKASSFLVPRKQYFEFDLTQECVTGHEEFWRSGAKAGVYLRGTIVVVARSDAPLDVLLKDCVLYGVTTSRYQLLKGSSPAAIRFAEKSSRDGQRAFLFFASNGMDSVEIYPPPEMLSQDYLMAFQHADQPGWRIPED